MPSINVDVAYFQHPKILRLRARLGPEADVFPLRLWTYAGQYHPESGAFRNYSDRELENIIGWQGEPGALVTTLLELELLKEIFAHENKNVVSNGQQTPIGYQIHDWHEHCGHLALFKKRAKSAAKKRWKRYATSNATSNATSINQAMLDREPSTALILTNLSSTEHSSTKQNIAVQDSSELGEEKEKKRGLRRPKQPVAAAPSSASWDAYELAYRSRYGVAPVRNQQVNSLLCTLVKKLGAEEAPAIAAFYVQHNKAFYVEKRHPVNLLVQDAEGLRTQWATGLVATKREAESAAQRDEVLAQHERVMQNLERRLQRGTQ